MEANIGFIDYQADLSLYTPNPLDEDEGPVIVSTPFEFRSGRPQSISIGITAVCPITLENPTEEPIDLNYIRIYDSKPEGAFSLPWRKPPSAGSDEHCSVEPVTWGRGLLPCYTLTLWLSCKPQGLGQHTAVILIDYLDRNLQRVAILMAEDDVSLSLASTAFGESKMYPLSVEPFAFGIRPPKVRSAPLYEEKLMIPNDVRELLQDKNVPEVLQQGLSRKTYAQFFTALLIMEEIYLEGEMRCCDTKRVKLTRRQRGFSLKISVLAERRPSLVYGDLVFAKPLSAGPDEETLTYQGHIFRVRSDEVFLHFTGDFESRCKKDCLYDVHFSYNRGYVRRLYQAIELAQKVRSNILFPSDRSRRKVVKKVPFKPIICELNEEQMHAAETILACRGSPPYVIHGPPGTGKTLTLIEAVLQLYTSPKDARVLICAASNSAADHIREWLLGNNGVQVRENEIFRLNVDSRAFDDGTSDIFRFGNAEESFLECPDYSVLRHYRIIISTYSRASCLQSKGIRRGHFSHIFLDDAGQASEPEAMVPISSLCNAHTVVVLAGDQMQLGPVVYSRDADSLGLGKSYLERLLEADRYREEDEMHVTKLVRNYRSHPSILDLPSKLFYQGELVSCKYDTQSSKFEFSFLPNKEFPVIFYGVQGWDEWEGNIPSWFNRFEVSKVSEIVKELALCNVGMEEIGVITPYRRQATKISEVLAKYEMSDVKVGSVEQFQGQEREVIIVSSVRSTAKHIEFDEKFRLGLINHPKRFNVAMTRAKSLLIIVANPHIVCKDANWNQLLWYCVDNKSYQGCPLPDRQKPRVMGLPRSSDTKSWGSPEEGGTSSDEEISADEEDLKFFHIPDTEDEYDGNWSDW